jgi:serine/threonine-protein kinase
VAIGIATLVWTLNADRDDTVRPVTRATVTLPADQQLDTTNMAAPLALSPGGRTLVYVAYSAGQARLHVRNLDAFVATPIAGSEGARYPFFSPDGEWVAFFSQGKLKRVSLQGGSPVTICDAPVVGRGGTWAPDGTIVFDPGDSGLMRVAASGGTPEPVTSRDGAMDRTNLSWPHFLPDGRVVLATAGVGFNSRMVALSLDTGEWRDIGEGFQAQYLPPGYLVFHAPAVREGEIHVVRFDATQLAVRGAAASVLSGVFRSTNGGGAYFSLSRSGSVIFAAGGHARTLVRVERSGRRTPLTIDRRGFRGPEISPDGRRIAVTVDPRPSQIWVYDIVRGSGIPLVTGGHNLGASWTPDARHVIYTSDGDMYVRAADASDEARRVLARDGAQYAGAWLQDGRTLIFSDDHSTTNRSDIWLMPADSDPCPLVATRAHELSPGLSRDGRWFAYSSDETGRQEVYVRPFPNIGDGKWIVSTSGGVAPVWSPSSKELFYMSGRALMSVAFTVQSAVFSAAAPEQLFDGPFETGSPAFDISPDGSYFVMVEADPDARPTQIHLVLDWIQDLARSAPLHDR